MRYPRNLRGPIFVAVSVVILGTAAWKQSVPSPDPDNLTGTWTVDLRPTPDAEPYLQTFVVISVSEKGFEGEFYGTPIEEGRLEGTTHSLGRDFLAYWTATRD